MRSEHIWQLEENEEELSQLALTFDVHMEKLSFLFF